MTTRILIADDHGVLRAGLRALLEKDKDLEVVGEAADGIEAIRLAGELAPDLVLLDISMPGLSGVEVTQQLHNRLPQIRVLILTVHEDDGLLREAFRVGAAGYIVKRAVESELINAIHVVQHGDIYIYPSMNRALLRDLTSLTGSGPKEVEALTPREIEVLRLVARGYTNTQIADALSISSRTVEGHRANITSKLGLRSRVELINYAEEHGLLR